MVIIHRTDKRHKEICKFCGLIVEKYEILYGSEHWEWRALPHKAPCGLPCIPDKSDIDKNTPVHMDPDYPCPACGALRVKEIWAVEKKDRTAKVAIVQDTIDQALTVKVYELKEKTWVLCESYITGEAKTVEEAMEIAYEYVEWLGSPKFKKESPLSPDEVIKILFEDKSSSPYLSPEEIEKIYLKNKIPLENKPSHPPTTPQTESK